MIRKEFLVSELKYRYPQMTDVIRHPLEPVNRPLFFEPEAKRTSARIYICTAGQLTGIALGDPVKPLFLCAGKPEEEVLRRYDVCAFPEQTDRQKLFNFVQRLFDRLDEWNEKLKEIAETGSDCSELLESAEEMLQNPVWLCDEERHTVARAERFYGELSDGYLAESYKLLDEHCIDGGTGKPYRSKAAEGTELLCESFSAAGARFVLLCASKERPFYGSDEVVFENLGGFVKMMLSEHKISVRALRQNRKNDHIEQQLRALLDQTSSENDAYALLEKQGWTEGERYLTLALETLSGDMRPARVHTICDRMESAVAECCAFSCPPMIAAVIRIDEANEQSVEKVLRDFADGESLRVGISGPTAGFAYFPQRMRQAKFARNAAARENRALLRFEDAADDYIARQAIAELPVELVCFGSVWKMMRYDIEHGTNYLETTVSYVKNHFNAVKTANALFIHRSTFLYRLERIQTQFGLNLEGEQATTLHFLLSLRLAEQMKTS